MRFLEEVVHRATSECDRATTFSSLVEGLKELNVHIETENPRTGEIVTRCLTRFVTLFFWRCWSDKLIFAVTEHHPTGSRITISAVPNLLRFRIAGGERPIELSQLLSRLNLRT